MVGNGGREHALGWKLHQSPKVKKLFFAPGNGGTLQLGTNLESNPHDKRKLYREITRHKIDFVIVAQDEYLAAGLVDYLLSKKIATFGPTKAAAKVEWSKSFAKRLMVQEHIPTAQFKTFTEYTKALAYIKTQKYPLVLKADGLIYGKGVVLPNSFIEAKKALNDMFNKRIFGKAGAKVVVEEHLHGQEISIHAFCDGKNAILFPASEDHKRAFDGDKGPNTGGVGSIVPIPWVLPSHLKEIQEKIVTPLLRALQKRGTPFRGVLYPGIMLTPEGPKVIEFNARFGDPEAQSYMHLLSTDLMDIVLACTKGSLRNQKVKWHKGYEVCVIAASGGYPTAYKTGYPIYGLDNKTKDIVVFQANTKRVGKGVVTNGGRVLGVSALAPTLPGAIRKAYTALKKIRFKDMQYRQDIGAKSVSKR